MQKIKKCDIDVPTSVTVPYSFQMYEDATSKSQVKQKTQ